MLLQHRCLSSTSTEQDSALHGIRSQLSPAALLPPAQLGLHKPNREVCKRMRIDLQPQLRTVSRKLVILFNHNLFAGCKKSTQNHRLRVRFLANAMLGYCSSWLFGVNGRGALVREPQRQVGRVNCSESQELHGGTVEFKCQNSSCIDKAQITILNGKPWGSGSAINCISPDELQAEATPALGLRVMPDSKSVLRMSHECKYLSFRSGGSFAEHLLKTHPVGALSCDMRP